MYIPYTFMWKNVRYITLVGLEIDDFLKDTDVVNYKNAMPWAVFVQSKINPRKNMERQSGMNFNNLPVVTATEAEEADGLWNMKGELNGKEIILTHTALYEDGKLLCGEGDIPANMEKEVKEDVEKERDDVKAEADEPAAESAEVPPAPETIKESAPVKAADNQRDTSEEEREKAFQQMRDFNSYGVGFGKRESVVSEEKILGSAKTDVSLAFGIDFQENGDYVMLRGRRGAVVQQTPPAPKRVERKPYPWSKIVSYDEPETMIGYDKPEMQTTVEPQPVPRRETFIPKAPEPVTQTYVEPKPQPQPQPETRIPNVTPWTDSGNAATEQAGVLPKEPQAPTQDLGKEMKEAFRSTLSEDVNRVIGDIPHSMLGSIEEFTSNDVDLNQLEELGEMYCIDHRWRKCGKWFCIDVVNHFSRYFYNNKLGVSIEIPVATCKEWLKIVTGGLQ